jgi:precorrin-6B methylase 1
MTDKKRYLEVLKRNKGKLNEIDLGEQLGYTEERTEQLIAELLQEHKIKFVTELNCSYRVAKRG